MALAIVALIFIYVLWKLFVDGWLFKGTLFIFGWFGIYICLRTYVEGATNTAVTLGTNFEVSWAAVIPTVICVLALACTKGD